MNRKRVKEKLDRFRRQTEVLTWSDASLLKKNVRALCVPGRRGDTAVNVAGLRVLLNMSRSLNLNDSEGKMWTGGRSVCVYGGGVGEGQGLYKSTRQVPSAFQMIYTDVWKVNAVDITYPHRPLGTYKTSFLQNVVPSI